MIKEAQYRAYRRIFPCNASDLGRPVPEPVGVSRAMEFHKLGVGWIRTDAI